MAVDVKKILEGAGISGTALDRIRLARGVVGKLSTVAGIVLVVLAIAAYKLEDPRYIIGVVGCAIFIFLVYQFGVLWFAHKHPDHALLEGAELVQIREMEMAAKNIPLLRATPAIDATDAVVAIKGLRDTEQ